MVSGSWFELSRGREGVMNWVGSTIESQFPLCFLWSLSMAPTLARAICGRLRDSKKKKKKKKKKGDSIVA